MVYLCFLNIDCQGQNFKYLAERYQTEHGLPDDYIKDIDFDTKGNVWILSRKGITMFDGFTFKTQTIPSKIPFDEFVMDEKDRLWINVAFPKSKRNIKDRIIIYDTRLDKVYKLDEVIKLGEFNNSRLANIWSDYKKRIFINYDKEAIFQLTNDSLVRISKNESKLNVDFKNIYSDKIVFLNPRQNTIMTQSLETGEQELFQEKDLNYLIFKGNDFAFKSYHTVNKPSENRVFGIPQINLLAQDLDTLVNTSNNDIKYVFQDNDLYFISNGIIYVYDLERKKQKNLSEELFPLFSQLDFVVIKEYDNAVWIGTSDGLIKIKKQKNIFQSFLDDSNISMREMIALSNDSLLACTENGLYLLDLENEKVLTSFEEGHVFYGISQLNNGSFIIGGFGPSIKIVDSKIKHLQDYIRHDEFISFLNSYEDKNGLIWIASNYGLFTYDQNEQELNQQFELSLGDTFFSDIIAGVDKSKLFALSQSGLFEIDVDLMTIRQFNNLREKIVTHIVEDKDQANSFWIGTRFEGLLRWEYNDSIHLSLKESDGLSNNNIHSTFEDAYGRLWMSTDYGISVYNKKTEEISTITEKNGLHENEMNRNSYCFVNDSLIVYGGINGIIKYNPYEIELEEIDKDLGLKSISYTDKYDGGKYTKTLLDDQATLFIRRRQLNPKLIFDIPKNSYSNLLKFTFSSEGDEEWSYTQSNEIDISKIKEGSNNLFVSKRIGINEWSSPKHYEIYVYQPFHRSYLFLSIILCSIALGIFIYINVRRERAERINAAIQGEVDLKTKELYYKNKSLSESKRLNEQLFSILGHDLRSPLISLNNLSKSLKYLSDRGEFKEAIKLSKKVESNSKKSLKIIDRLIDWTEEQKASSLDFTELNVKRILYDVIDEQLEFTNRKDIQIVLSGDSDLKCVSNEKSLLIVFGNILSNAMKFSKQNGKIDIVCSKNGNEIVVEVKDYGIGMNAAQLKSIQNITPVHSKEGYDGKEGLGVGLLLSAQVISKVKGFMNFDSKLGKGTTVKVVLPL